MNDMENSQAQLEIISGPLKDTLKIFDSPVGPIQYGFPPLGDRLALDQLKEIPQYYIVPLNVFNKKNGKFLGEFEIPLQYNMKHRNIKTTLICTQEQQEAIRAYLDECIIGGEIDHKLFPQEFHSSFDYSGAPVFRNESAMIQKFVNNSVPIENIDQLVEFRVFNQINSVAELNENCYLKLYDKQNIIEVHCNNKKKHIIKMNEVEEEIYNATNVYLDDFYSKITDRYENCSVPQFGVTGLFSPFNPTRQSGFFFWVNSRIVIVDPPIYTNRYLQALQIPNQLIDWVILTHCHTENDIGVMQRFVDSQRMEIITTPQIIHSFIRKYSKISDINSEIMRRLFKFKPVVIGAGINLNGCIIRFHYSFHQIPTIGFEITNQNKSIYYSGDTYYDPKFYLQLEKARQITSKRYEFLSNIKFIHNIILFDGGNTFAATNLKILHKLPEDVKKNIYLTNLSEKTVQDLHSMHELPSSTLLVNKTQNSMSMIQNKNLQVFQSGLLSKLELEIIRHKVMDYIGKLEILSSIDVFEGLTIKNIRDLMDISHEEYFNKGQIVIKQNTRGSKWYIILKGKIQIKNQYFEGHFQDGEYFGETALGEDNSGLRMADCIAETDVTLLILEKQDFWFAFGQGSESMGRKILEKQARLVISRKQQGIMDLRKNRFFKEYLGSNQMTQLQMISKLKTVKKGEYIWTNQSKASFSLLLKKGQLQMIFQSNQNNNNQGVQGQDDFEVEKKTLQEGCFIGDLNALIEDAYHTTSLVALDEEVVYWRIDRGDLLSFLRRNPGLFLAFGDSKYFS